MLDQDRSTRDLRLLFLARAVRMFGYGLLSVVLLLYLSAAGLSPHEQGLLLSLTLVGDTVLTLWLVTQADRFGRRRTLLAGAALMLLAGAVFSMSTSFLVLLTAATIGVISPSGSEVGPFLSVEQAALSQIVAPRERTSAYAWYHVVGISASAVGALLGGLLTSQAREWGWTGIDAYRPVLWGYSACGLGIAWLTSRLRPQVEAPLRTPPGDAVAATRWGLHRSRGIVGKLSLLFAFDAFGGGFILQSILAYWLHVRYGVNEADLGRIFFAANLLSGASGLAAGRLANRIGLINTMVFTHLPASLMLLILAWMPDVASAVALLLVRYSISQMDVPARQAYTMAVVAPDERSAAAGVTSVARSIGAAASPAIATSLIAEPAFIAAPLMIAGAIKAMYDVVLFVAFSRQEVLDSEPHES
ncbi:MAG: MFS transporter [Planctomyces sp.]|nr:MFS transporter [Planctomyces sp.]